MSFDPIKWSDKPLQWDEVPEIVTHELSCPQWLDYMGMRYTHTKHDFEANHPVYLDGKLVGRTDIRVFSGCTCGNRHYSVTIVA
jgi:hypothetical protein